MRSKRMFSTVDTHTAGQPTRTIIGGIPCIPGKTMEEKMKYIKENKDWIRTALMYEPRGNDIMSGVIITEPCNPNADIGVIFIEVGGYLPMCGHDTIGVSTALIETGMIEPVEPYTFISLDTPAGLVKVKVRVEDGEAKEVSLENIPSFVMEKDLEIDVPEIGNIKVDISYGGNVYAIVDADELGLEIIPGNVGEIIRYGNLIRKELNDKVEIIHPEKYFVNEVTHVEFSTKPSKTEYSCKNTVVIPYGSVDRSPCGTGSSAKLASLYTDGLLKIDEEFIHESIIGTTFKCRIVDTARVGEFEAVITEITGKAYITGTHTFHIDPEDPLGEGFKIG